MVKHVVMWKLRGPSEEERREQARRVQAALFALRGNIPGMSSLEVGVGASAGEQHADVVLLTVHDDWASLSAYQSHPAHLVAAQIIGEVRVERRVLDFEI